MADDVRDDILSSLLPCSYGGVPFLFQSGTEVGGHRATERPILHSSEQLVSNVGPRQDAFNLRGYIASRDEVDAATGDIRTERTYKEHRDALRAVFKDPAPKTLVHPLAGAVQGCVARSWAIDEEQDAWGCGKVSVEFIIDTSQATPVRDLGIASAVVEAAEVSKASFLAALVEKWNVDPATVGAYEDGLTKAREAFTAMQNIANEAETLTDSLDALAAATSEGIAAATTLIMTPQRLATDIGNALSVLASVFPTAVTAFDGLVNGFSFGDLDFTIDLDDPSARIRKQNADAMNAAMKGALLASAYAFATGIEFGTLDEIERVEGLLDEQANAIVDLGTATSEALGSMEDLRTAFAAFLDRARLSARRIVSDDTAPCTPRTLAFALYGDDALAGTLAGLNGVLSYELLSGRVTVLSS